MTRLFLTAACIVAALSGCGGTLCDRLTAADDAFFAGKTECSYAEGGVTITLTKKGTCKSSSSCSSDSDQKALDAYATCLARAQTCTTGNEKKATSDGTACGVTLFGAASQACLQGM